MPMVGLCEKEDEISKVSDRAMAIELVYEVDVLSVCRRKWQEY